MKKIAEMRFEPPPECATCGGLGYLLAPVADIIGGDGSIVGDIQGEDVRCPDCQPPIKMAGPLS